MTNSQGICTFASFVEKEASLSDNIVADVVTDVETKVDSSRSARLGTQPIASLLAEYALPAIMATVASSLYNIVDRIFIGNGVGPYAIAGLSIAMPIMNLTTAFGSMLGVGSSTLVSIRLGQKRRDEAQQVLGTTLLLNILVGLAVCICGLIWLEPILRLFGASEQVLPYAKEFMQVILIANVFNHNFLGFNAVMRATGYPRKAMLSTFITVLVNLVLAPIFIFVFDWGIRGAALATAGAQVTGFVWVMMHFCDKRHSIRFEWRYIRLKLKVIGDVISIGSSNFLMHACTCLMVIILNNSLAHYGGAEGDMAIAAYGICNSVVMLFLMVVIGLNQGMQPIVGYNFGAKLNSRMMQAYKLTLLVATAVTTAGFLIGELFPRGIVSLFTNDETLIRLSTTCLRTILISFPVVGFQMVTTTFFQSVGKAAWSIFLSLSRQLIFLIPGLIILPRIFGFSGVWAALPTGDILASILTAIVIALKIKKFVEAPVAKDLRN